MTFNDLQRSFNTTVGSYAYYRSIKDYNHRLRFEYFEFEILQLQNLDWTSILIPFPIMDECETEQVYSIEKEYELSTDQIQLVFFFG